METSVFDNEILDKWLEDRTQEILENIKQRKITHEDMQVLTLKSLSNRYHHMNQEFRGELQDLREDMDQGFKRVDGELKELRENMSQGFKESKADLKELKADMDKRFDNMTITLRWGFALFVTVQLMQIMNNYLVFR